MAEGPPVVGRLPEEGRLPEDGWLPEEGEEGELPEEGKLPEEGRLPAEDMSVGTESACMVLRYGQPQGPLMVVTTLDPSSVP